MTIGRLPNCVFCKITRGEEKAEIVYRWIDTVAFVPLNPVVKGHYLVVPKYHVEDFTSFPTVSARTMMRASMIASPNCNLITSAGKDATQTIFHMHLHVIPRREGDGLKLPWTDQIIPTKS